MSILHLLIDHGQYHSYSKTHKKSIACLSTLEEKNQVHSNNIFCIKIQFKKHR